jgi:hypothetical protein
MTRAIDSSTITALQSDAFDMAHLIQLDFSTVLRLTEWGRNISALSSTFVSSPHIVGIGDSSESTDIRANSIDLVMSGVEQTFIAIFLNNNYMDVRARIWKAVLGAGDSIVGAPFLVFDGRISGYNIRDDSGSSEISIEMSSHWKDFELSKGRRTNRNSQQFFFPSDKGMDFSGVIVRNLKWGKG